MVFLDNLYQKDCSRNINIMLPNQDCLGESLSYQNYEKSSTLYRLYMYISLYIFIYEMVFAVVLQTS